MLLVLILVVRGKFNLILRSQNLQLLPRRILRLCLRRQYDRAIAAVGHANAAFLTGEQQGARWRVSGELGVLVREAYLVLNLILAAPDIHRPNNILTQLRQICLPESRLQLLLILGGDDEGRSGTDVLIHALKVVSVQR